MLRTSRNKLWYKLNINKELIISGNSYTLSSTLAHKGQTANGGRCVAYTKRQSKTFLVNDSTAKTYNEHSIGNQFYIKKDENEEVQ